MSLFFGVCSGDDEGSVSNNKSQNWDGRLSNENESRKQSSDSLHLDLSSNCINGNNHLNIDYRGEKMSSKTAFSVTADSTMILTNPQEKLVTTTRVLLILVL